MTCLGFLYVCNYFGYNGLWSRPPCTGVSKGPGLKVPPRSAFWVLLGTCLGVPQRVPKSAFECFGTFGSKKTPESTAFRPGPLGTPVNGGRDRKQWHPGGSALRYKFALTKCSGGRCQLELLSGNLSWLGAQRSVKESFSLIRPRPKTSFWHHNKLEVCNKHQQLLDAKTDCKCGLVYCSAGKFGKCPNFKRGDQARKPWSQHCHRGALTIL